MVIDKNEYEEIVITDKKNNIIAIISDEDIVEHNNYKVILNKKEMERKE